MTEKEFNETVAMQASVILNGQFPQDDGRLYIVHACTDKEGYSHVSVFNTTHESSEMVCSFTTKNKNVDPFKTWTDSATKAMIDDLIDIVGKYQEGKNNVQGKDNNIPVQSN